MPRFERMTVSRTTWDLIHAGMKPTLLRTDDRIFSRLTTGTQLRLYRQGNGKVLRRIIVDTRRYESLEAALEKENMSALAHGDREEAHFFLLEVLPEVLHPHHTLVALDLRPA